MDFDYCIDGKLKLLSDDSLLVYKNNLRIEKVKLDNLEFIVLHQLCCKAQSIVTYGELLENWRSSEVSDSAISRVISLLRKKLKAAGYDGSVITNTSRKGYTLNLPAQIIPLVSNDIHEKNIVSNFFNPASILKIFFGLMVILGVGIFTKLNPPTKISSTYETVEILKDDFIKTDLNFNLHTGSVAYVIRSDLQKKSIIIKKQFTNKSLNIIEMEFHLDSPTWIDEVTLVYREYNNNSCRIKKLRINEDLVYENAKLIFTCNEKTAGASIAAFRDNKILFTNSPLGKAPTSLYVGDIESGKVSLVTQLVDQGVGIYKVVTSPLSNYVAILSSKDWNTNVISLIDPDDNWNVFWEKKSSAINHSIAWDGEQLSLKNDTGGITNFLFDDKNELSSFVIPTSENIYNIVSSNNGLAFFAGDIFNKNIQEINLLNGKGQELTQSIASTNSHGKYLNNSMIIYISNQTGINQLWLFDVNTKETWQLTTFKKNIRYENLTISPKGDYLALQSPDFVLLYSLSTSKPNVNFVSKFEGVNPSFYKETLLYSSFDGDKYNILSFDINRKKQHDLVIDGGYIARRDGDNLYYSKVKLPGIWRLNGTDKDDLVFSNYYDFHNWYISGGIILYTNYKGSFIYDIENETNKPVSLEQCKNVTDFSNMQCLDTKTSKSSTRLILWVEND